MAVAGGLLAVTRVEHRQSSDGGWSFKHGLESDCDSTAMTLLALAETTEGPLVLPKAQTFARDKQLPNGRWRTWQSSDDWAAPDVTAHMVTALQAHNTFTIELDRARRWLTLAQNKEWKADWYIPSAYAIREIAAAIGWTRMPTRDVAQHLLEHQHDDGGWPAHPNGPSSPASTGMALSTLAALQAAIPSNALANALHYLLSRQRPDGSWPGTPIMYGPRPLLAHFPTHTHAFATAGLGDLLSGWRIETA